jgi:DNA repair photolyase
MANKKRNTVETLRQAMSPVYSRSAQSLPILRPRDSANLDRLFPECPERLEVQGTIPLFNSFVPAEDRHGSAANRTVPDCPPVSSTCSELQIQEAGPVRSTAGAPHHRPKGRMAGLARLAAAARGAETRRGSAGKPEFFVLPVKSILNKCDSDRVPFEWTINPYRGCEFGCKYCYARYTHEFMELDGAEFEKKIFVKQDAAPLLVREIAKKYSYHSARSGGEKPDHIAIGTATDPYQPAEREYGVTRACLEQLAKRDGLSISLITKSNQIVRDIEVLKRIQERSELSINITVTTLRTRLARLLEPRAPRPDLRLAAVQKLHAAGLAVGVSAAPLIPGITDGETELEALAKAARDAGAQWLWAGVLFLMPSSAKQFLPFVREKFPRLAKQYEGWYSREAYAPEEYRRQMTERLGKLKAKYGLSSRPRPEVPRPHLSEQLSLAWNSPAAPQSEPGIAGHRPSCARA